jgi:hypothetical protein
MTEFAAPQTDPETGAAAADEQGARAAEGFEAPTGAFSSNLGAPSWAASREDENPTLYIALIGGVVILAVIALIAGASGSPQFSIGLGLGVAVGAVPYLVFIAIHAGANSRTGDGKRRRRMTQDEWERVFGRESNGSDAAAGSPGAEDPHASGSSDPAVSAAAALQRAYDLLEVSPQAGSREVRSAYHRLAQQHHPDKFVGQSEEARAVAGLRMREVNAAYALIRESRKRPVTA